MEMRGADELQVGGNATDSEVMRQRDTGKQSENDNGITTQVEYDQSIVGNRNELSSIMQAQFD